MAVDTAAKRFSMMNFGTQPIHPLFIPDGSINDGDKYHLLTLYSGISLSAVTAPVFSGNLSDLDISAGTTKTVDYSSYFSDATSYSISPAVESGWSFNTSTGILTVLETTVSQYGSYVITGTNAGGSADSNAFYINVRAASVGGNYGVRHIDEYKEEIRLLLAKEEKEARKEKKKLEKKEIRLEAKLTLPNGQIEKTRLELEKVSKSLLTVEKDLAEIEKKRAEINLRARIMRDDDEIMMLLMSKGYV